MTNFFIFSCKKRLTFDLFWAYNSQAVVEKQPLEKMNMRVCWNWQTG